MRITNPGLKGVHRGRTRCRAGILFILGAFLAWPLPALSQAGKGTSPPIIQANPRYTTLGIPRSTVLNINSLKMWASDNGMMERLPDLSSGVTFPRGTVAVVHGGGILWGGYVRDGHPPQNRVGGQTFTVGTMPGRIVRPGIPESPENADVRIYRIRKDWASADLTQDAADYFREPPIDVTSQDIARLREIYRKDWMEWPWQKGAPYYERNGIPGYQPDPAGRVDSTTDEPGLGGADQVIWYVANDLNAQATSSLYGSPPIGLELQVTCWAYSSISDLQNVIFQRFRLIYKGTATTPSTTVINDMYISKWADIDVGDYSDDFAGCSPDLGLAYCYNSTETDAEYQKYSMTPPVVGYDLLEGPRVQSPGSTAHFDLRIVPNFQNLPMTSFTYFDQTSRTEDYNVGSYSSTRFWLDAMAGDLPRMTDYLTHQPSKFELTGDPETYQGWIDGLQEPAGDRRITFSSGPFTMAYGDTQEVVVGLMAGFGTNNRSGISVLKSIHAKAHDAYNLSFNFPVAIPTAHVRVDELDKTVILDWESDTSRIRETEGYNSRGYTFESYTIYQFPLPTTPKEGAIVYQHFDPTKPRFVYITTDKLRNRPLVNGQKYYFGISTTVYNPDPSVAQHRLESPVTPFQVVPHSPNPGVVYPYAIGEQLPAALNLTGFDDADVSASYYDPTRPDGHVYKIRFFRFTDPLKDLDTKPTWTLIDSTVNDTLLRDRPSDGPPDRVITRGFQVKIQLPVHGLRGVYQMRYAHQTAYDPVFNQPNPGGQYMIVGGGASDLDTIKGQQATDEDVELRFNGDSSWALMYNPVSAPASRWIRVPYTAWSVHIAGGDTTNRQLYTLVTDQGQDSIWRPGVLLDREYNGKTLKVFYPLTIVNDSAQLGLSFIGGRYYDDAPYRADAAVLRGFLWLNGQSTSMMVSVRKFYIADLDEDGAPAPAGTTVRFIHYKEVRSGDEKLFLPTSVRSDDPAATQAALSQINVFPNPYYGANRTEINRLNKFVTFNHLPYAAVIRIFTISGILVKTIQKNDDTQFATWDLNNENGLQAGGGVYLAYCELKDRAGNDLGSKVLKLMVVPGDLSPEKE